MPIPRQRLEVWATNLSSDAALIEGEAVSVAGQDPVLDALIATQVAKVRKARDAFLKEAFQRQIAEIDAATADLAAKKAAVQASIAGL